MPIVLDGPRLVTVDTFVYAIHSEIRDSVIHRYDPETQQWTKLPEYLYEVFTITEFNNQLVVVGGEDKTTHKVTNTVGVYCTSQRSWTHPYPPMNTPRSSPAVSTYYQHLVVAGGRDDRGKLATVEILDTSTYDSRWLSIASMSLPVSCSDMLSATVNDTLYLLGGTLGKQVLSVSLLALTQTDKPHEQWRTLPNTPLEYSTPIAVHGFLLAVGGSHDEQSSSAIHVYDQEKNAWTKVGDLPTEREDCACCLLPNGEILVAGGGDQNGQYAERMDIVTVTVWD